MMGRALIFMAFAAPALADSGPPEDYSGFHHSTLYMVDGLALPVRCDCEKEVPGFFIIYIDTPFENLAQASTAALDYAKRVCVAKGYTRVDPSSFDVGFYSSDNIPHELSYGGICQ